MTIIFSRATAQLIQKQELPADAVEVSLESAKIIQSALVQGLPFELLADGTVTVAPTPQHKYYKDKDRWIDYAYQYSASTGACYPSDMLDQYADKPADLQPITADVYAEIVAARSKGLSFVVKSDGESVNVTPSVAHVYDKKTSEWVLDKDKQAALEKQALDAADAQLTCLMSQMCAWLTIESYKPKTDQRGGNILSPVKIDEMLQGLPSSVETDLMRNAWSRATRIEFTSATTQSFAQILDMSKDQLRIAMTEAKAL